jgi:hypothetical protein
MGQVDTLLRRHVEAVIAELCGLGWDMRGITAALDYGARVSFARYTSGAGVVTMELVALSAELAALVRESKELADIHALEEATPTRYMPMTPEEVAEQNRLVATFDFCELVTELEEVTQ